MDKEAAKKLVQEVLEKPFDKGHFVKLVKNILKHVEDAPFSYRGNLIFDDFSNSIQLVERVGKYSGPDDKLVDILIVHLKKETSLERARTKQRNYVAKYLKGSRGGVFKDAALVAFVAPGGDDWRFSFVKMEYKFNEKGKVKEEFTPARRYSFLVGENERSHTAQSCLLPILLVDDVKPTLENLEEVFSVEKVTREFFEKYRDLFWRLKDALDEIIKKRAHVRADFKAKEVSSADFAKKLLGQIVFLYFLQKKGWFGVERGQQWGSGSKHFLRELFDKRHGRYKNFFNDILEPLFYEALRLERPGDYYHQFDCRIPFLNGGLFDPINDYDWVDTDILFPNEIFSNKNRTKEGDEGDGVLDVFDRYNFTVKEDEPLEKEVAIDPEMLGKVFENLLEVKDRKSKGTYYTPREIVHYMCQESLANYLTSELAGYGRKGDFELLIQHGEASVEHDKAHVKKSAEGAHDTAGAPYKGRYDKAKLPLSVRRQAGLIDEKLESIRICDPAVGSGAFVVGMMNEIVKARCALSVHIDGGGERSPYLFKRQVIQNCLYGVDIDPGAVEIAKLRLWLSLVVDEEDREQVQPLPNLDYKIVQGNSLLGFPFTSRGLKKIEVLKQKLFEETRPGAKEQLKVEIEQEIETRLANSLRSLGYQVDFDFKVFFSEVFHKKRGFDVVIGNPPYIQLQKSGGQLGRLYKNAGFTTLTSSGDIYQLFYERGMQLLAPQQGLLCYITSNSWLKAEYGKKTRRYFHEKHTPLRLLEIGKDVFENAIVDSSILVVRSGKSSEIGKAVDMDRLPNRDFPPNEKLWGLFRSQDEKPWSALSALEQPILEKIETAGRPLKEWDVSIYRGVTTGYNDAFIIDTATRKSLIARDPKSTKIIKPILRGRDIQRYRAEWAGLWLIDTHNGYGNVPPVNITSYPAIKNHLNGFYSQLKKRQDKGKTPYNLRNCAYHEQFTKEKLFWMDLTDTGRFAYVQESMFCNNTVFMINGKSLKYLCAILNSNIVFWFMSNTALTSGMGVTRWVVFTVETIPIPKITATKQRPFIQLVDRILTAKASDPSVDTSKWEAEIDRLVYKLYGLTEKEIGVVEREDKR